VDTRKIGYDRAAEISKEAYKTGRTIRERTEVWSPGSAEELESWL
jgi:fumarate hydratase class II